LWRKAAHRIHSKEHAPRHPAASSSLDEFTQPKDFRPLFRDREVQDAKRILMASGKVGHELKAERRRRKGQPPPAILFLDQLYPLPRTEISAALAEHPNAREVIWVQEEPRNMGAYFYVVPRAGIAGQVRWVAAPFGSSAPPARVRRPVPPKRTKMETENSAFLGLHDDHQRTETAFFFIPRGRFGFNNAIHIHVTGVVTTPGKQ